MPITTTSSVRPGIVSVTADYPPVNAIPSRGWFELADAITAAGRDLSHVVILQAGAAASTPASTSRNLPPGLHRPDRRQPGCYESLPRGLRVPVVAAVHGFCVGGGIGLVGNADVIVASDDAKFGLPEVERGALVRHPPVGWFAPAQRCGGCSSPRPPSCRDLCTLRLGARGGALRRSGRGTCLRVARDIS